MGEPGRQPPKRGELLPLLNRGLLELGDPTYESEDVLVGGGLVA